MTYVLIDNVSGRVIARGLSLTEAAEAILTDGGREYEIRPDPDGLGHCLYVSRQSRNLYGGNGGFAAAWSRGRPIYSVETDRDAAWREIAAQVVAADWDRAVIAVPDDASGA